MPTTSESRKTTDRKAMPRSRRRNSSTRKAAPRPRNAAGLFEYGESASRFLARSQQALASAYDWAGSKGRRIPEAIKRAHLPDARSLQSLAEEKSAILGAVGIGVGILIGAMLPSMGSSSRRAKGRRAGSRRYH